MATMQPEVDTADSHQVPRQEYENMQWCKRIFYMSRERLFPGFQMSMRIRQENFLYSARAKASVPLGLLLICSYYFSFMWAIGFACQVGYRQPTLKRVHGGLLFGGSLMFIGINYIRLKFGMRGNSEDDVALLGVYWMMTVLIELPLVTFLLLTDFFSPYFIPFITIMDILAGILMISEALLGFFHLQQLIRTELKVLRLSHDTRRVDRPKMAVPAHRDFQIIDSSIIPDSENNGRGTKVQEKSDRKVKTESTGKDGVNNNKASAENESAPVHVESKPSVPFSNLEEEEAQYIWDVSETEAE